MKTIEEWVHLAVAAQRTVNKLLEEHRMSEDMDDQFQAYKRTQIAEMRPYKPGESLEGVNVGEVDKANGSPKAGDMIARNPSNHEDQWLVAAAYFAANFEPTPRG